MYELKLTVVIFTIYVFNRKNGMYLKNRNSAEKNLSRMMLIFKFVTALFLQKMN